MRRNIAISTGKSNSLATLRRLWPRQPDNQAVQALNILCRRLHPLDHIADAEDQLVAHIGRSEIPALIQQQHQLVVLAVTPQELTQAVEQQSNPTHQYLHLFVDSFLELE